MVIRSNFSKIYGTIVLATVNLHLVSGLSNSFGAYIEHIDV